MRLSLLPLALTLIAGCAAAPGGGTPAPAQAPTQTAQTGTPQPVETKPAATVDPACVAKFDEFNVEKDTFLSFDEYVNGKYGEIRFIKAPTPQEEADMKAGLRQEAQAADQDGDGKLSRQEFTATCEG